MPDGSIEREIGRLQAQNEAQKKQLDSMEAKLDTVLGFMQSATGSWKTLVGVGFVSSTVTAVALKVWALLKGG